MEAAQKILGTARGFEAASFPPLLYVVVAAQPFCQCVFPYFNAFAYVLN